jgi:hypothetical protein
LSKKLVSLMCEMDELITGDLRKDKPKAKHLVKVARVAAQAAHWHFFDRDKYLRSVEELKRLSAEFKA